MLTQTRPETQTRRLAVPDLGRVQGASGPGRPRIIRRGRHLRGLLDRLIAGSSLVPNDPVLDMRDFAWTCELRRQWRAIRDEAVVVALDRGAAPQRWRSFCLYGDGDAIAGNIDRCPATAAAVANVPGLVGAFFSILAPGTHIPARRGATKGLITCHLGLVVPPDGDVRMRIADRVVRWAEGETLVFDDTWDHEVWNDSAGNRIVLLIQFRRPLARPGRWIADLLLGAVRRSAVERAARGDRHARHRAVDT